MQIVVRISLLALLSCFLIIGSAASPYKDCGSKLGKILSIDISNCSAVPCRLKRGTNVTVTMKFSADADITKAFTKVYGYVASIPIRFNVPDDNACDFMKCPISKGATASYTNQLMIKKEYPPVQVVIEWETHINTEDGEMITCFETEAQIE